jgi:transcriptional regulator with XRE-family HTH domain
MDPFLAFLKALRERAGLTQIELSYKAGLSETYYGKIESGERRPSPRVVLELLQALAATTLELLVHLVWHHLEHATLQAQVQVHLAPMAPTGPRLPAAHGRRLRGHRA